MTPPSELIDKDALIATYAANFTLSAIVFPRFGPVPDAAMFRRSSALCLDVVGWRVEAGRSASGRSGYRQIAECRTGAEGPGLLADMGVATDPKARPNWRGGLVDGIVTTEPNHTSLITQLLSGAPLLRPMLVAARPAPGLAASMPPTTAGVTNNHRGYAVQWFLFAAIATVIYGLALRRRSS